VEESLELVQIDRTSSSSDALGLSLGELLDVAVQRPENDCDLGCHCDDKVEVDVD